MFEVSTYDNLFTRFYLELMCSTWPFQDVHLLENTSNVPISDEKSFKVCWRQSARDLIICSFNGQRKAALVLLGFRARLIMMGNTSVHLAVALVMFMKRNEMLHESG